MFMVTVYNGHVHPRERVCLEEFDTFGEAIGLAAKYAPQGFTYEIAMKKEDD